MAAQLPIIVTNGIIWCYVVDSEYNDNVRALASMVKKKDKRVLEAKAKADEVARVKADELKQKAADAKVKQKAQRETAKVLEEKRLVEQEEERRRRYGDDEEEVEKKSEFFECVLCDKTFKSNGAWLAHEKSKKHLAAVAELKESMVECVPCELHFLDDDELIKHQKTIEHKARVAALREVIDILPSLPCIIGIITCSIP
jgi:hypothetical protein